MNQIIFLCNLLFTFTPVGKSFTCLSLFYAIGNELERDCKVWLDVSVHGTQHEHLRTQDISGKLGRKILSSKSFGQVNAEVLNNCTCY